LRSLAAKALYCIPHHASAKFQPMPGVKKPITVRIDPALLEQVRLGAARDNRSITNFIETALRERLNIGSPDRSGELLYSRTMTEIATK
jgi:hypothetical protein